MNKDINLQEAYAILDEVLDFFKFVANEYNNGKLKKRFLKIPVKTIKIPEGKGEWGGSRDFFLYGDEDIKTIKYIVDIRPVELFFTYIADRPDGERFIRYYKNILWECLVAYPAPCVFPTDILFSILRRNRERLYYGNGIPRTIKDAMDGILFFMFERIFRKELTDAAFDDRDEIKNGKERVPFLEPILTQIEELRSEKEQLGKENAKLKQQLDDKVTEQAFNARTELPCFTNKQMGILMRAVSEITEAPDPPAKTQLGEVVERIAGYKATTVNQNMKGNTSEKDKKVVAEAIEDKLPKLAEQVRKL